MHFPSKSSFARIKTYERSESIVVFELQQVLAKNCPELSKAKLKRPSEARA
jgi:hypothetical protein